jgi:hypothetical protein
MRKLKYLYLFAGMLLLATSCTTYQKSMNTAPINVQMNITMADMDYVGEVTGTATQSFVLGIPYGGRRFYYPIAEFSGASPLGGLNYTLLRNRGLSNAMWDALQQRPDADFLIPVSVDVKTNQEFLGSKKTYTVRAKAFKIKAK